MARRLVNPPRPFPTATRIAADYLIRPVDLDSIEFVTVSIPRTKRGERPTVKGKFVRVAPRVGATEAQVQEFVRWAEADGAKGIKVLAIPRPDVISADKAREVMEAIDDLTGENRNNTISTVVAELVEQSTISDELKPLLLQYCQTTLEESDVPDDD